MINRQIHLHLKIIEIVTMKSNNTIENDHILICKFFLLWTLIFSLLSFRENIDAKVYVGNVPTEKMTDEELLDFFKPFGKVSGLENFFFLGG